MHCQADEEAEAEAAAATAVAAAAPSGRAGDRAAVDFAARAYSESDDEAASDASSQSTSDRARESGAGASQCDARPGSVASTYWRPERCDRKNLLSTVDERCAAACLANFCTAMLDVNKTHHPSKPHHAWLVKQAVRRTALFPLPPELTFGVRLPGCRFEHLALDYDEDEIGSLDEEDTAAQVGSATDCYGDRQFSCVLWHMRPHA